jgi:CheY-like chemotaxis protein
MTSDNKTVVDRQARKLFRDAVRSALTAAGFPEKEHNLQLRAALQITNTAAYRKLTMEAGWTDGDIAAVANFLNVGVEQVLANAAGLSVGVDAVQAKIEISGETYSCHVQTDGLATNKRFSELVLKHSDNAASIVPFDDAAGNEPLFIKKILISPNQHRMFSVAILEDDINSLELAGEILSHRNVKTELFQSIESIRDQLQRKHFDVVVLDWWVHGEDVGALISDIRRNPLNSKSIIAIVTGKIRSDGTKDSNESEFERLISTHGVKIYSKPVRWSFLAAEWAVDLNANI